MSTTASTTSTNGRTFLNRGLPPPTTPRAGAGSGSSETTTSVWSTSSCPIIGRNRRFAAQQRATLAASHPTTWVVGRCGLRSSLLDRWPWSSSWFRACCASRCVRVCRACGGGSSDVRCSATARHAAGERNLDGDNSRGSTPRAAAARMQPGLHSLLLLRRHSCSQACLP